MTILYNHKHKCWDIQRERPIRHVPLDYPKPVKKDMPVGIKILCAAAGVAIGLLLMTLLFGCKDEAFAGEVWKITAYCACKKCCGPNAQGVTASGKQVKEGMVACNWLKFGTQVEIEGMGYFKVEDRGAKSLFGSKTNHIKHIDVYMPTHQAALQFGVKWLEVRVG